MQEFSMPNRGNHTINRAIVLLAILVLPIPSIIHCKEKKGEDLKISSKPNSLVLVSPVFDNGPGKRKEIKMENVRLLKSLNYVEAPKGEK
jgi:hypothetical protein